MSSNDAKTPETPVNLAQGRPSKLCVVGAGAVGTAVAYSAAISGVARSIALYDINGPKVRAEGLDIAHGIQFMPVGAVEGSDDINILQGSDMVIVTAGAKQKPGQTRMELAESTVGLMKNIIPEMMAVAPDAIYMFVTNPVDVVTYAAIQIMGRSAGHVFGSGTVLDSSRFRYLISRETGVSSKSIHAMIAGEHGDSQVALWSSAEIGNVPVDQWGPTLTGRIFDPELKNEIAQDVINSAYHIIEGKGATNYAIGVASTYIAGSVLRDEHRVMTVSTYLDDWNGISDVCMAVPTVVGRQGAGRILEPPLSVEELRGLRKCADQIRQAARSLGF
ncbi:MAG: L-lactate dehydrogenase [Scrofimicrobium sp.]